MRFNVRAVLDLRSSGERPDLAARSFYYSINVTPSDLPLLMGWGGVGGLGGGGSTQEGQGS